MLYSDNTIAFLCLSHICDEIFAFLLETKITIQHYIVINSLKYCI